MFSSIKKGIHREQRDRIWIALLLLFLAILAYFI